LCLITFVFFASRLFAAVEFIWPLQQNYGISATFGESREDHFHAGIDLSTNGETGLPVLAVADGLIYRMKIQKRAYGKALYLRHADGRESLYAHLEGYSEELGLQKIYLAKTNEMKTPYVGDIFIDPPIPVKQGQIVAYSGESGAGLPHLHFEVRENQNIAVNPLTNGLRDTLDPVPPTFQACYFYPLTAESAVNGDLETKELRFKKTDSGYQSDYTPIVRGDFIVSVSVYDSALRPYHRAPKKITYSIDHRELYAIDFDRLSYVQPDGFGLFYDLGKPGPSYYEFPMILSKLVDFSVPFVNKSIPFSTRTLSSGKHQLTIQASDSNNNVSVAEIPFVVNHPPRLSLDSIGADQSDLIVKSTIVNANGQGAVLSQVDYSTDNGKKFSHFSRTALDVTSSAKYEYRIGLNALRPAHSILIRARAFDGVEYSPYEFRRIQLGATPLEQPEGLLTGDLRYDAYRDAVRVVFETDAPVSGKPQVSVGNPPALFTLEANELTSRAAVIPVPKQTGTTTISLSQRQTLDIPVYFASAAKAASITNGNFQLSIPANGLYAETFIWTKLLPEYRSKSLPLMAPILQLGPRGTALNHDAELSFPYRSGVLHPEKLSIYKWDRVRQRWSSLPSKIDRSSRAVRTRISYFDLYALLYDNVAPVIQSIFPKRQSVTSNNTPTLVAGIRDAGMDVDDEKVTFFIDGIPHAAEYDPDRNTATLKITKPLNSGYHKFFVRALDYGGNKTQSAAVSFRVK
jgi:hypothetical protein